MAPKPIPDRWLDYQPIGQRVLGTRFIAFKVPLREDVVSAVKDELRLSCNSLLKKIPNLGLIIDLTNTNRYYDPYFFTKRGIRYEKLMIPGHEIPPAHLVQRFKKMARDYLRENPNNTKLIGVHCTHGVNRTGYLICSFMLSEMKMDPNEAMKSFEAARGHPIERQNYRSDLLRGLQLAKEREPTNWRLRTDSNPRPKGFSRPYNREETNSRNWHDHSPPISNGYGSIYRNQGDESNYRSRNAFRRRDYGSSRHEYQSFDPSRSRDHSREDGALRDRSRGDGALRDRSRGDGVLRDPSRGDGVLRDRSRGDGVLRDRSRGDGVLRDRSRGDGVLRDRSKGDGILRQYKRTD